MIGGQVVATNLSLVTENGIERTMAGHKVG